MSQNEDTVQVEENVSTETLALTKLTEATGEGQETESTSDEHQIDQIDLGLMHFIARSWLGQNSTPWKALCLATGINTAMALFDTFSDIAVAVQLIQNGDYLWGMTVLLIDYLPMWLVILHALTSDAWKNLEDGKERWITGLILIFSPVAFPLLQLYWLMKMRIAKKSTFNFLHQNAKVAELVCGTVESPLQFLLLMICYAYNKLPLPWNEEKVFTDSVGNEFNFGALPGILSVCFSCLTMIKSTVDVSESKTIKEAISYGAYSFTTCVFRLTGYLLVIIILRELSVAMFVLIAFVTLTAIVRFDKSAWRGMSWCTTFIVGLFIPCAVSKEPHKYQYKGETTTTTTETTSSRRILTSTIAIRAIPIILLFNAIVFGFLYLPWYHVSSDLLMDESDSKRSIKAIIIFLVLPTGICSFIGALCMRQEKRRTVSTVGLVLMAVLTITCLTGSFIHVFIVDNCTPDPCSNFELCRNDVFTHRCDKDSYSTPTQKGYCGIDPGGKRHEHCRCQDVNEDINDCRAKCDGNSGCIAYSFRHRFKQCYLYTTNGCSSTCEKRMKGQVGNLRERLDNVNCNITDDCQPTNIHNFTGSACTFPSDQTSRTCLIEDNLDSFCEWDGSKMFHVVEISRIDSSNFNCQIPKLPTKFYGQPTITTSTGIISCGDYGINRHTYRYYLLHHDRRLICNCEFEFDNLVS